MGPAPARATRSRSSSRGDLRDQRLPTSATRTSACWNPWRALSVVLAEVPPPEQALLAAARDAQPCTARCLAACAPAAIATKYYRRRRRPARLLAQPRCLRASRRNRAHRGGGSVLRTGAVRQSVRTALVCCRSREPGSGRSACRAALQAANNYPATSSVNRRRSVGILASVTKPCTAHLRAQGLRRDRASAVRGGSRLLLSWRAAGAGAAVKAARAVPLPDCQAFFVLHSIPACATSANRSRCFCSHCQCAGTRASANRLESSCVG